MIIITVKQNKSDNSRNESQVDESKDENIVLIKF